MENFNRRYVLNILVLLLLAQIATSQEVALNAPDHHLTQFTKEYTQDYRSLTRFYSIENSPERRERLVRFFNETFSKLDEFPYDQLSSSGKVDFILIKRAIENSLYKLSKEKEEYESLTKWISYGKPIYQIEKQRRRGKHLDSKEVAGQLQEMMESIESLSNHLSDSNTTFPKPLAQRAQGIISGHREALKSVHDFYSGYDPQFSWWVTKPYEEIDIALEEYSSLLWTRVDSSTLSKDDGSGIVGNPIGKQEILRQLQHEMIPYSPEELVEIALKEFAWCEKELLKASAEMGYGDNWKEAQEKVKNTYVPVGHQPEEMYKLYNESIEFLKTHDLLTIPPLAEETWRMVMLSPERQLIAPFFLGGEVLQIAYPTDDMSHENKLMSLRGNNPHFARAVVHHELIAGHHLQQFMNKRHKSYRFSWTPFWTEGWALYWEMLLWDQGFAESPEDKIGMLFWRMHRCARIIFSLNYHLEKWTPQECIDYLVDKVGHERTTAEGEVRRSFTGNYGPLYQIAYMIGGLQFYELKRELVDSGKMTHKEFHDAVLRENSIPVEMVRAILMDQDLDKNFKTQWRFYGN